MGAEIHCPGVVFPDRGDLIAAGYFGKTENMIAGDPGGASIVRGGSFVPPVLSGHLPVLVAEHILACQAIGSYLGVNWEKYPIADQQAGSSFRLPVGADKVGGDFEFATLLFVSFKEIMRVHAITYAIDTPDCEAGIGFALAGGCPTLLMDEGSLGKNGSPARREPIFLPELTARPPRRTQRT